MTDPNSWPPGPRDVRVQLTGGRKVVPVLRYLGRDDDGIDRWAAVVDVDPLEVCGMTVAPRPPCYSVHLTIGSPS